jgi:LysM repeat protein
MKRISFLLVALALLASAPVRAQDAATEERLSKLNGRLDDFKEGQEGLRTQIQALSREIASLREEASKPSPSYASQEDLKRLADAVKEIDRKRLEDYEKIRAEILKLGKTLSVAPSPRKPSPASTSDDTTSTPDNPTQKVFEYVIQKGDSLSLIVAAYREKNIKVTTDQILKANHGLKANNLRVGQKIYIPAPSKD